MLVIGIYLKTPGILKALNMREYALEQCSNIPEYI